MLHCPRVLFQLLIQTTYFPILCKEPKTPGLLWGFITSCGIPYFAPQGTTSLPEEAHELQEPNTNFNSNLTTPFQVNYQLTVFNFHIDDIIVDFSNRELQQLIVPEMAPKYCSSCQCHLFLTVDTSGWTFFPTILNITLHSGELIILSKNVQPVTVDMLSLWLPHRYRTRWRAGVGEISKQPLLPIELMKHYSTSKCQNGQRSFRHKGGDKPSGSSHGQQCDACSQLHPHLQASSSCQPPTPGGM